MKRNLTILLAAFTIYTANSQEWVEINSPTTDDINSCSFIDENTGWIVTGDAIYKTSDGGATWTAQVPPVTPPFMVRRYNCINFLDENTGIIGCTNFVTDYQSYDSSLVSTTAWTSNGGETWVYKNLGNSNSHISAAIMVTPMIAYTIGQYGQSRKTLDGGETWTSLTYSAPGYSGTSLVAINENVVYFAGLQNFELTGAFGTLNNSHWTVNDVSEFSIRSMFFSDQNKGWIGASNGTIMTTNNAGGTWSPCNTNITSAITGISFKDNSNGWATTQDGVILKSVDEGLNWVPDYQGTTMLTDIEFHDLNNIGYAVGFEGLVLKYEPNLSVNPSEKKANVLIYPVPAKNNVIIKIGNIDIQGLKIVIHNSLGQEIKTITDLSSTEIMLETQTFSNGIYYINIEENGKVSIIKKLIVAH